MVISDTSCTIDGLPLLYWRRNLGKSGQDSLDNIVGLGNGIACARSHMTLGEIARLHNCAVVA